MHAVQTLHVREKHARRCGQEYHHLDLHFYFTNQLVGTRDVMVDFPCPTAIIRIPRRYPLVLLVFLIPLSIFLYVSFGEQVVAWAPNKFKTVPVPPTLVYPSNTSDSAVASIQRVLLVSAFFPLSKSKHSFAQYSTWLSQFLGRVTTPVYFYTPPDFEATVRAIRGSLPIVVDTRFETAFDVPPLKGRERDYVRMHEWDREKTKHSPELYAVWAAKPFLLAEALRRLREGGNTTDLGIKDTGAVEYVFWSDAGSFRNKHTYSAWPDPGRLDEVWKEGASLTGLENNELMFFPVWQLPHVTMQLWSERLGPIDNNVFEGSFFGGRLEVAEWWERYYYAYHDHYLAQHVFVGKDQALVNALILLRPSHFFGVWHGDPESSAALYKPATVSPADTELVLGNCGDTWFYYQFFLANEVEREEMTRIWVGRWRLDFWHRSWWTRTRESCRLTRTVDMLSLLRRRLGDRWNPPPSSVQF